jgi:hypothetical protein
VLPLLLSHALLVLISPPDNCVLTHTVWSKHSLLWVHRNAPCSALSPSHALELFERVGVSSPILWTVNPWNGHAHGGCGYRAQTMLPPWFGGGVGGNPTPSVPLTPTASIFGEGGCTCFRRAGWFCGGLGRRSAILRLRGRPCAGHVCSLPARMVATTCHLAGPAVAPPPLPHATTIMIVAPRCARLRACQAHVRSRRR